MPVYSGLISRQRLIDYITWKKSSNDFYVELLKDNKKRKLTIPQLIAQRERSQEEFNICKHLLDWLSTSPAKRRPLTTYYQVWYWYFYWSAVYYEIWANNWEHPEARRCRLWLADMKNQRLAALSVPLKKAS